jgi:hypothetical protein
MKTLRNWAVFPNEDGRASTGPNPPARFVAHTSSARPATIKNGAAQASSTLIELLPRTTMYMFQAQKSMNPKAWANGGSHCGIATCSIV